MQLPRALRFFPGARLFGAPAAYPVLAAIDRELSACRSGGQAAEAAERAKSGLYASLRARFSTLPAQALTTKILNLFLARFHFRARSVQLGSRPIGLVIDPSNTCRLACPGCVHSGNPDASKWFNWPNGTLPDNRFAQLLRTYGAYAVGVYFCNYGEPLLNVRTPRLIRMAKSHLLSAALSTSLSVQRFDAEAYVESGLDVMVLAIDGVTQPVYERFRRGGSLELALDNVRQLVRAKRRLRRRTPLLAWNFLAFAHNAHQIPAARRLARDLGVNQFRIVKPFPVGWDDPEIQPAAVEPKVYRLDLHSRHLAPENWNPLPDSVAAAEIEEAFARPWVGLADGEEPPRAGHTCHWLYQNMVMDAGGRILPCCGPPGPETNLVFARWPEDGDVFNAENYRAARAFFATGATPAASAPHCVRCEWDHSSVNIGPAEIRRYFRAADPVYFDGRSLRLFSAW